MQKTSWRLDIQSETHKRSLDENCKFMHHQTINGFKAIGMVDITWGKSEKGSKNLVRSAVYKTDAYFV